MESGRRDPYRYFRVEARELIEQLSAGVLALEGAASSQDLSRLLRLAHTLKGAARVVRQREIADLVHGLEDTLAPYRDGTARVPRDQITATLATLDVIAGHLARLPVVEGASAPPTGEVQTEAPRVVRTVRAELADVNALLDGLGQVQSGLGSLRVAATDAERARRLAASLTGQVSSLRGGDARRSPNAPATARVRAMADELHRTIAGIERRVGVGVEHLDRELRQAREQTERLRLVSADVLFTPLRRLVRESADNVGKRVVFVAEGANVRLDSDILDTVQSALVQIAINGVVHGIETPDVRVAAGKPPEGRIVFSVARSGSRIVFRCADDGRGVDLEGVRRALQRSNAQVEGADRMGAAELLRALLKGGITTAATVTGMAGRGVGLDVVREVSERLGGEVSVQTRDGIGTTIELTVPASFVAIEALIVEVGGARAALPMESVRGARRVEQADVQRASGGDALEYDGGRVPLVALEALLARSAPRIESASRQTKAMSAVLVGTPGTNAGTVTAVIVDRLVGSETIVLRPLPALAPARPIVAGVYIDADGNARPVLNLEALPSQMKSAMARRESPSVPAPLPVLVIDDSLTTRMLEQSILESAGYVVETATSAEEGLEKARAGNFGLFLVDVEMPGMDGFTFVERYHADPALRHVPSILVTSRDAPEDRERGEAAGASAYIVKGAFDQAEFLDRVAALLKS